MTSKTGDDSDQLVILLPQTVLGAVKRLGTDSGNLTVRLKCNVCSRERKVSSAAICDRPAKLSDKAGPQERRVEVSGMRWSDARNQLLLEADKQSLGGCFV